MDKKTAQAYKHCEQIASSHYENFPVATLLLPKWSRKPVSAIYAFARIADDYADEGNIDKSDRLKNLKKLEEALSTIEAGETPEFHIMLALQDTIKNHQLPIKPFKDLLNAFKQDVEQSRYENFESLLDYCALSASAIGELMLALFKVNSEENLRYSSQLCTALQLINFWQDIGSDFEYRNRVYVPKVYLEQTGVTEAHLARGVSGPEMLVLMTQLIEKTEAILTASKPITSALKGRLGLQVRVTYACAETIINKLKAPDHNLFVPARINMWDWAPILKRAHQLKKAPAKTLEPAIKAQ